MTYDATIHFPGAWQYAKYILALALPHVLRRRFVYRLSAQNVRPNHFLKQRHQFARRTQKCFIIAATISPAMSYQGCYLAGLVVAPLFELLFVPPAICTIVELLFCRKVPTL
jgi:hypothetical protein